MGSKWLFDGVIDSAEHAGMLLMALVVLKALQTACGRLELL